jgi:hypothetical protein
LFLLPVFIVFSEVFVCKKEVLLPKGQVLLHGKTPFGFLFLTNPPWQHGINQVFS